LIPSRTITEREIVVGDINCPMAKDKWAKSPLNHDTWDVTLLSRKSYTLTIDYSFGLARSARSNTNCVLGNNNTTSAIIEIDGVF